MNEYAPVIIFAFNRPFETLKLINSLIECEVLKNTDVFVFIDGPRNDSDIELVNSVKLVFDDEFIRHCKSVSIRSEVRNKGLASSVIDGVGQIIKEYGRVIVLEDDLICSQDFLTYMNSTLSFYVSNKSIWSIAGFNPKIITDKVNDDLFLFPRTCSWGWATWEDRWSLVDWTIPGYDDFFCNSVAKKKFEVGGNDLCKMLDLQIRKKIDSWAIRWCFYQFLNNSYTIYPKYSKIINNGFSSGGTHTTGSDSRFDVEFDQSKSISCVKLSIKKEIIIHVKKFYDLDFIMRISYFSKKYGFNKHIRFARKYLRS